MVGCVRKVGSVWEVYFVLVPGCLSTSGCVRKVLISLLSPLVSSSGVSLCLSFILSGGDREVYSYTGVPRILSVVVWCVGRVVLNVICLPV